MSEPDQRNNLFERILISPLPQELGGEGGLCHIRPRFSLPRSWGRGEGGCVIFDQDFKTKWEKVLWRRNLERRHLHIENRVYREEFTRKMCKTAILLYYFYAASVLYIFVLHNLLGPGISFYTKSKINVKRKPNFEIGWFHNWPMIISHRLYYAFHFANDDFPL